jgi:hypothetical protein
MIHKKPHSFTIFTMFSPYAPPPRVKNDKNLDDGEWTKAALLSWSFAKQNSRKR